MRRSLAPSIRKAGLQSELHTIPLPKKVHKDVISDLINNGGDSKENDETATTYYNVTYAKRSSRKHKIWEGDGILEVKNARKCSLRDLSGTVLGTATIKTEEIFDGSRLIVGNKQIELHEKILGNPNFLSKPHRDDYDLAIPSKEKKKKSSGFLHNSQISPPVLKLIGITAELDNSGIDIFAFFPKPCHEHQVKFNSRNLPITTVEIPCNLLKHLRPHQIEGIVFLYECILGFRNLDYFGCILADDMGLGKTLQCLSLCNILLKQGPYGGLPVLRKILIVTPSSLIESWNNEVKKWLNGERMSSYVVDAKHRIKYYSGQARIPFVIVSYEMLVKNIEEFQHSGFDLLICDEGHRLKNNSIKAALCLNQLNIHRRIVLTGTPIQNDLEEYFHIVDFVNPGILGDYNDYRSHYELPIIESQTPDAKSDIKQLGIIKAAELKDKTKHFILRRGQEINRKYLPNKDELIIFVRPSQLQQCLLYKALEWYELNQDSICNAFQIINVLKKICSHPSLLKTTSNQDAPLVKFLIQLLPNWQKMGIFNSGKLEIVHNFLVELISRNEKVVLVSHHTKTLDMLMGLCEHYGYKYLRLDGTSSDRSGIVERFNQEGSDIYVFLLSSKAGGVGLNLCGASRLILFDNDWNPATDLQAMSRIWRDGQKNDVNIYRLITAGTIEEKIFQRQISKLSLGGSVMDQQQDNMNAMKFSKEDLKDLFSIPDNFDTCATHDSLNCATCESTCPASHDVETTPNLPIKFNELMQWEHLKPPFKSELLQEICLTNASEHILFIFRNQMTTPVVVS